MPRNSTLVRQIVAVVGLTALAKLGSFGKDILLSFQFGVGQETDAYFIANTIPGFFFAGILASIGLVFLPIYQRALAEKGNNAAIAARTAMLTYGVLSLLISITTIVLAEALVEFIAPNSTPDIKGLATMLTRILACGFVFSGWVGLQSAMSQAQKRFIWPQVVPVANHIVVILGLCIAYLTEGSIALLAIFAVLGWVFLASITVVAIQRPDTDETIVPSTFSTTIFKQLALLSLPVFFSQSLEQLNYLIDIYLGSSFGIGAISHLTYASRLMMLFSGAFGIIISYFVFPYLSESIQLRDYEKAQRYISRGVLAVIAFTLPLAIICLLRAPDLISLAFKRGAFSDADVAASATVLIFFAPGILFNGLREVLNRVFLSTQQTHRLLAFGLVGAITNVLASVYLSKTMGLSGVALGTTIGAVAYVLAQIIALVFTRFSLLPFHLLLAPIIIAFASAGMWLWLAHSVDNEFFSGSTGTIIDLVIGIFVYAALLLVSLLSLQKWIKI